MEKLERTKKYGTRRNLVPWFFVLFTLWRLLWSTTVHRHAKTKSICFIHQVIWKFYKSNAQCSCDLKRKLLKKNVHPIRSNIVNTNIFRYFKRKTTIYVINFKENLNIFKIERDKNILWRYLCIYTLTTDGLQPIKLHLFKELLYNTIYYLLKIIQKFWLVKNGGWNRHIRLVIAQLWSYDIIIEYWNTYTTLWRNLFVYWKHLCDLMTSY